MHGPDIGVGCPGSQAVRVGTAGLLGGQSTEEITHRGRMTQETGEAGEGRQGGGAPEADVGGVREMDLAVANTQASSSEGGACESGRQQAAQSSESRRCGASPGSAVFRLHRVLFRPHHLVGCASCQEECTAKPEGHKHTCDARTRLCLLRQTQQPEVKSWRSPTGKSTLAMRGLSTCTSSTTTTCTWAFDDSHFLARL